MSLKTIAFGLTVKIPNRGHNPWTSDFETEFANKVSEHDHTGSGKGIQIGSTALANNAVTALKIATDAVETAKIKDLNVTTAKIADEAVTAEKLAAAVAELMMPSGVVLPYAGSSAPSGYLLCNGAAVSRSTYAALFAVIGVSYGAGDGSTTFNVPDMRDRLPIGKGTTLSTLGATGGTLGHVHAGPSHTHTVPAHYHGMGTGSDLNITASGVHSHVAAAANSFVMNGSGGLNANASGSSGYQLAQPTTTATTHVHNKEDFAGRIGLVTGGDNGNSGMTSGTSGAGNTGAADPPYQVHNFIIKT